MPDISLLLVDRIKSENLGYALKTQSEEYTYTSGTNILLEKNRIKEILSVYNKTQSRYENVLSLDAVTNEIILNSMVETTPSIASGDLLSIDFINWENQEYFTMEDGKLVVSAFLKEKVIDYTEDLDELAFFQLFSDNGDNDGSFDINVDGSTVYKDFYISSKNDGLLIISKLNIEIVNSSSTKQRDFGDITNGLTNGCELIIKQNGVENIIYTLKKNKEITVMCGANNYNLFGSVESSKDLSLWTLNLEATIKLRKGSSDRIILRVKDDLTSLDEFKIMGVGKKIL